MRYESYRMNHTVLCRTNDDHIYWCTVVPCLTEFKDLPNGDRYRLFKIHIVKGIYQIYAIKFTKISKATFQNGTLVNYFPIWSSIRKKVHEVRRSGLTNVYKWFCECRGFFISLINLTATVL